MTDRHEHEWGKWHPWCATYRCVYPGCYKNMPSDEVKRRLNAAERLSAEMANKWYTKLHGQRVREIALALRAYAEARGE